MNTHIKIAGAAEKRRWTLIYSNAEERLPPKMIYQFKITLKETHPPVWRRIQVPSTYTFWDLHVAIQDAMGWLDCHLHEFRIKTKTGENLGPLSC